MPRLPNLFVPLSRLSVVCDGFVGEQIVHPPRFPISRPFLCAPTDDSDMIYIVITYEIEIWYTYAYEPSTRALFELIPKWIQIPFYSYSLSMTVK